MARLDYGLREGHGEAGQVHTKALRGLSRDPYGPPADHREGRRGDHNMGHQKRSNTWQPSRAATAWQTAVAGSALRVQGAEPDAARERVGEDDVGRLR